ncbi:DgyrCDS4474 [Dimorphilus gyrociliatus]|nr:DgyrCDS4474 [Dimorphilus gyrociliatus]
MVYGLCICPVSKKEDLKNMSFADSKTLNEQQRDDLMQELMKATDYGYLVHALSSRFISNSMLGRTKYNLNALSHDTAIGLVERAIQNGVQIDELYVDTVGDPTKYEQKLKNIWPDIDITVSKKADAKYPVVSAASICAKTVRDAFIFEWKKLNNAEAGSGYTSDPHTKTYLANNYDEVFGYPTFVRTSWATCSKLMDEKCITVSWPDEEDNAKQGKSSLQNYMKNTRQRYMYFNERCLSNAKNF